MVTAGGRLLAAHNRRGPEALRSLLEQGLAAFDPARDAAPDARPERPDPRFARRLPEGGLALEAYARILSWDPALQTDAAPFQRQMMAWNRDRAGFDHLWLRREDLAALVPRRLEEGVRYRAPRAVERRLARFHLTDFVRGEPPMFASREVRRAEMRLEVERVTPEEVHIRASGRFVQDGSDRSDFPVRFDGSLEGRLVLDRATGTFSRFDLLCEGTFEGSGRWTPGAPQGPFRLAVAVRLPPGDFATEIPPQGMRDPDSYWRP